jgi:nucleotide-binding universal stress UspA family protein
MPAIRTILHPTDLSEHSRPAFQMACSSAREHDARLVLLYVLPPSAAPLLPEPHPDLSGAGAPPESLPGRFAWPRPPDPGVRVEYRLAEGDPADEIVRLAGALPCDLIVMGTHGRTGLGRLLQGSVAEAVLRQAPCPVLAVKPPAPEATPAAAPAGEVVDARPLGSALAAARTQTLARADGVEIIRLVVPAGKEIRQPWAKGKAVVHCLEGRVAVTGPARTRDLEPGELLLLSRQDPIAITGLEDASLLLTVLLPGR